MTFKSMTADLSNVEVAIQYGLIKIQEFAEDQLAIDDQVTTESLEVLIIKRIISNYKSHSEQDDYIDFLDTILDCLDHEYDMIENFNGCDD